MSFASYIRAITAMMTASGIAASMLIVELSRPFLLFMVAVTTICLLVYIKRPLKLPTYTWNIAAILIFAILIVDYLFITKTLVGSSAKFLVVLAALKLLDLNTTRDYILLYTIIFFELLASAASTVSPMFFVVLALYVICFIWAMIVFNVKGDCEQYSKESGGIKDNGNNVFGPAFFLTTVAITVVSVATTLVLFFIIPRMGMGFFESRTFNAISVTGFSDEVQLGEIGSVKLDPTVIMRVEFPERRPNKDKQWRLRGASLDHYDGKAWKRSIKDKKRLNVNKKGLFTHGKRDGEELIEQNIMLEPIDTDVLFAIPGWLAIDGRYRSVYTDYSDAIYLRSPHFNRIEYTAWSLGTDGVESELSPRMRQLYLQLPPDVSRVRSLAASLTEALPTAFEKARAIERHLKTGYRYTLDTRKGEGKTPLDDFLFYTKEGFCEQYATAMAIMLRTIEIPSRLVTGYIEGPWNSYGNYYMIRQQEAHSWVEAYIDGEGWVTFDPTASSGLSSSLDYSTVALYIDTLRWRWNKHIINYTLSDQIEMARNVEGSAVRLRRFLKDAIERFKPNFKNNGNLGTPITVAVLLISAFLIYLVIRRSKGAGANPKTPKFYLEMLRVMESKGLKKKPSEAPGEFAARIGIKETILITECFSSIRYGGEQTSNEKNEEMASMIEALKKKDIIKQETTTPS